MNKLNVGLVLLSRPFEVWLASYILLLVIKRKEFPTWVNYVLIGLNAFATGITIYGLANLQKENVIGEVFASGLGAVLLASSIVIWIFWIFVRIYDGMSNNARGLTLSFYKKSKTDEMMLYYITPMSSWLCMIVLINTLVDASVRGELFHKLSTTIAFFISIIAIALNIWYLVTLVKRLDRYVVFGKNEIEIWNKDRCKVYRYRDIKRIKKISSKQNRYNITFLKGDIEEEIKLDDERAKNLLEQLLELNHQLGKQERIRKVAVTPANKQPANKQPANIQSAKRTTTQNTKQAATGTSRPKNQPAAQTSKAAPQTSKATAQTNNKTAQTAKKQTESSKKSDE